MDLPDGALRIAYFQGCDRWEVEGKRVTVVGVLRVVDHPDRRFGDILVLPWTSIAVVER